MTNTLLTLINRLYWAADRTIAPTDWNYDLFECLSRIDEEDYE